MPKGQVIALDLTKEREEFNHQQATIKREIQKLRQLKSKLNLSAGLDDEIVFVPVLNGQDHLQSVPCDIKLIPFPSAWLEIKESSLGQDIAIVEVTADAMSPTLNSGDKVLIDLATNSLQPNALYR